MKYYSLLDIIKSEHIAYMLLTWLRRRIMKKHLSFSVLLMLFLLLGALMLAIPNIRVIAQEQSYEPVEGKRFEAADSYELPAIASEIRSLEAELWIDPNSAEDDAFGALISNYSTGNDGYTKMAWEITNGGRLRYYSSICGSVTFKADLRTFIDKDSFIKISVTINDFDDGQKLVLYVNGVAREGTTVNDNGEKLVIDCLIPGYNTTEGSTGGNSLRLGGDYTEGNQNFFKGHLKNITLYSDVRTSTEIRTFANADAYSVDSTDTALVAAYDTTGYVGKDLSSNGYNITFTTTAGMSFSKSGNLYHIRQAFDVVPRSYEAWVYVPDSVTGGGYLLGNYGSGNTNRLGFAVITQKPRLYYMQTNNKDASTASTFSDVDVKQNGWAHLALVHDGKTLFCYVNGVLVDSLSQSYDIATTVTQGNPLVVGGDWRSGNTQYFRGRVKDIAVYSSIKTAEQIKNSYLNGVNLDDESIMMYLDCENSTSTKIEDKTGNGYDAIKAPKEIPEVWVDSPFNADDYAYTFAVVGDTQKLCYKDYLNATDEDATNDTAYMATIYDWIVANREAQKIEFVIGVGDITEDDNDGEWDIAYDNITKLSNAGIPYSLIYGYGHDTVDKLDKYFGKEANFTDADIGYYDGTSLCNYYMKFTVGGTKYLLLGLDFGPTDNVLNWACDVIENNPEYTVIVTTHAYMSSDGTYITSEDSAVPRDLNDTNGKNNGDQMWTKLVSQYENVAYVFCGHAPSENIVFRQDIGIHGNAVSQFLVDPQNFDAYSSYRYKTGMVALFHISEDGKTIAVEWYSTVQDKYYLDKNQFEVTIPDKIVQQDVETEYGTIPGMYSNKQTYPFVLFKADRSFVGAYGDFGAAAEAVNANAYADYIMLMRRDAEQNQTSGLSNFYGTLTVDLGGNKLTKTGLGYLVTIMCSNNSHIATNVEQKGSFIFKNGNIHRTGGSALSTINYDSSLVKDVAISLKFEDIIFTSPSGSRLVFANWENGYLDTPDDVTVNVTADFIDCTFDYTNSATGITMLQLTNNGYDKTVVDVTLNGVKIIANEPITLDKFAQMDGNDNGRADSVIIKKSDSGEYLTMILPIDATAPTDENAWVDENGLSVVFVPKTSSQTSITYSTIPSLIKSFSAKQNITLWTNYIYNLYLPIDNLKEAKIDGEIIDIATAEKTELNGASYYVISVPLYTNTVLRSIPLEVTLAKGEEQVTINRSFCLFDYAKAIIEGSYTNEEKQLLADMLSYAKAAYDYANLESEYIDKINWLIGYSYDEENAPNLTPEAECPDSNTGFTSVSLHLDDKIAYRFYLEDGYTKDDFKFKVGNASITATEGTDEFGKAYLDVKVYAYQLCESISYTVEIDGVTTTQCYNIYSYYSYVTTNYSTNIALINFVERMIKYGESAVEYRNSIL